jgi:hypothetical protein
VKAIRHTLASALLLLAGASFASAQQPFPQLPANIGIPYNWNALQSFGANDLAIPSIASQCLTTNSSGVVVGDGSACSSVQMPIPAAMGDLLCGGPTVGAIQDCGAQPIKTGVNTRNPTTTDDSIQGYSVGSLWVNTSNQTLWSASSVVANAAVWFQPPPTPPVVSIGWSFATVPANVTYYTPPGGLGVNQNTAALSSFAGTFSNLYIRTADSPGTGNTYVFTLYVGAPVSMSATSVTCTISGASATTCNDATHTAAITAGQAWAIQVVTSTSATATAQSMASIGITY